MWDTADYRFLPNTVFVPNTSLPENCYSSRNGVFFTYVLQNGKVSALQDALESHGYPANILFCFDNGYTEIAETLHGFYSSAQQLLFAACITAGAALFVFLALFVNRQRRTLGLMLSLGASGDTELFEKASNINGFQGGRVANNLYISPFRATVFKTAALFLYPNSSVVIRVENLLFLSLWLAF